MRAIPATERPQTGKGAPLNLASCTRHPPERVPLLNRKMPIAVKHPTGMVAVTSGYVPRLKGTGDPGRCPSDSVSQGARLLDNFTAYRRRRIAGANRLHTMPGQLVRPVAPGSWRRLTSEPTRSPELRRPYESAYFFCLKALLPGPSRDSIHPHPSAKWQFEEGKCITISRGFV